LFPYCWRSQTWISDNYPIRLSSIAREAIRWPCRARRIRDGGPCSPISGVRDLLLLSEVGERPSSRAWTDQTKALRVYDHYEYWYQQHRFIVNYYSRACTPSSMRINYQ
jgi:hypothetical protein